jgi:hypothetical protein
VRENWDTIGPTRSVVACVEVIRGRDAMIEHFFYFGSFQFACVITCSGGMCERVCRVYSRAERTSRITALPTICDDLSRMNPRMSSACSSLYQLECIAGTSILCVQVQNWSIELIYTHTHTAVCAHCAPDRNSTLGLHTQTHCWQAGTSCR